MAKGDPDGDGGDCAAWDAWSTFDPSALQVAGPKLVRIKILFAILSFSADWTVACYIVFRLVRFRLLPHSPPVLPGHLAEVGLKPLLKVGAGLAAPVAWKISLADQL